MGCSHRLLDRFSLFLRYSTRHNSMIVRVSIYCATVLWRRVIYTPISSNPTISIATPIGAYTHFPYCICLGPCPPSAAPPGGGKPQGISPDRGSVPMSQTQIEAPLVPLPHKTYSPFSYLLPIFPKYSPVIPIVPEPYLGSVPLPSNFRRRTTTFVPST